ncbi:MAG: hypothetical protein ACK48V_00890 [Crocinitomicaceae bacterium]|jgi:hypothetical protein
MAKKTNTLTDLTKFLASEQNAIIADAPIDTPSFLQKEPITLIDTPELQPAEFKTFEKDVQKFIDSIALRETSFDEVNELIKTLALDHKMSVQQVLMLLYYKSIMPYSLVNWLDWTANIQKSYTLFMSDYQKKWWKR